MVPDDNEQKEIIVGVRDYRNSVSASNNEDIIKRNLLRNKQKKQKRENENLRDRDRHSNSINIQN